MNQRQHTLQVSIDVAVPHADHPKALTYKVAVPLYIASGMGIEIMLSAINFDNETVLEADEIYHMIIERRLAAEVESPAFP